LRLDAIGDVASYALHLRLLAGANDDFPPGDPANAFGGLDLLVIAAGAIGKQNPLALLDEGRMKAAAHEGIAVAPAELAEGIVGVGDEARCIAAYDDIPLRFQEAARALLGLLELPVAVGEVLRAAVQRAQAFPRAAQSDREPCDGAACCCANRAGDDCGKRIVDHHQQRQCRDPCCKRPHEKGGRAWQQAPPMVKDHPLALFDAEAFSHLECRFQPGERGRLYGTRASPQSNPAAPVLRLG